MRFPDNRKAEWAPSIFGERNNRILMFERDIRGLLGNNWIHTHKKEDKKTFVPSYC